MHHPGAGGVGWPVGTQADRQGQGAGFGDSGRQGLRPFWVLLFSGMHRGHPGTCPSWLEPVTVLSSNPVPGPPPMRPPTWPAPPVELTPTQRSPPPSTQQ